MPQASIETARQFVRSRFPELRSEILEHFRLLWDEPELPALEVRSAERLCRWLERHGFGVTRRLKGIPTAFAAARGTGGGPRIGILAEFDALPSLDNEAAPVRKSRGRKAGHACGHNHIAGANVGAAIVAASVLTELGIAGEVVLLGCPAEEILWGKLVMLERGAFDGLDAVLTSHADYQNGVISRPCQSVAMGEVVFYGVAGHTGSLQRRNALDGAELAVQTLERLRAHNFPDAIVEHVLRVAGVYPGITPDEARLWIAARHQDYERVWEVYDFLIDVCRRAAEMTGTTFRHQFISSSHGYLANDAVAGALYDCMTEVGPPRWSADDVDWMRRLAEACAPGDQFRMDRDIALYTEGMDPYGQDDGDLSWRVPLGRINWALPNQVPLHHWGMSALTGNAASDAGPLMASEVLAMAAVELAMRPDVLAQAQAELAGRVAGYQLAPPRVGAVETLINDPESFWDKTWIET